MVIRIKTILCVLMCSALPAAAQSILGTVRNAGGEPMEGVHVLLPQSHRGAVTGLDGTYIIDHVATGEHEIEFRYVGYATLKSWVWVPEDGPGVFDVVLEPESVQMQTILITAEGHAGAMLSRATRSVAILGEDDLRELQGRSLGDLLSRLPGVTTLTTGPSISKPVIRGLHSQRILVMQDGVGLEGQQWGGEHAPEIDPFSASRIEVVKGAAAVEYGAGAIGGVVRIDPADLPENTSVGGVVSLRGYTGNRQGAASIMLEGGPRSVPGLGWRARISGRRAGDSRTPDYVLGNTGFAELDANLSVGYHRGRSGMHVLASRFSTELGLYKGAHIGNVEDLLRAMERGQPLTEYAFTWDIAAPRQEITHDVALVRGHLGLRSGDVVEGHVGLQSNRRAEFDAHSRSGDASQPAFSLDLLSQSFDLKFRARPRGPWLGVVGLSLMNQTNRNGESGFLIPNYHALTAGAFSFVTRISKRWTHEAGIRVDLRRMEAWPRERLSVGPFVRRTHEWTAISANLGTIRKIGEHWSVATQASLAWRPPGVNELYNFGVHHGTAQFEVGDPDLGVERSRSGDVTVRHESERWTAEVSVFVNHIDGFIHLVPEAQPRVTIRGSFPSFRYGHADALLTGFDAGLTLALGHGFSTETSLSVVRGTDRLADQPLIFMPADRARLRFARSLVAGSRSVEVGINASIVARQTRYPEGIDFAEPPPAYELVGLDATGRFQMGSQHVDVTISADNLFNRSYRDYLSRYRYFVDDPGRTISLGLRMPFGSAD